MGNVPCRGCCLLRPLCQNPIGADQCVRTRTCYGGPGLGRTHRCAPTGFCAYRGPSSFSRNGPHVDGESRRTREVAQVGALTAKTTRPRGGSAHGVLWSSRTAEISRLNSGSPGRTRTANLVVNSHPLCRLSYRGMRAPWRRSSPKRRESVAKEALFVKGKPNRLEKLFEIDIDRSIECRFKAGARRRLAPTNFKPGCSPGP